MPIKRRGLIVVRYILFSIVLYIVGKTLFKQMAQLNLADFSIATPYIMASASCEIFARLFISAGYWLVLKFSDTPLPIRTVIGVTWLSFLGKYLPGKIAVVANSVYFFKKYEIPTSVAGIIPLLCTFMTIFVALVLSLPLLYSNNDVQNIANLLFIVLPFLCVGSLFSINPGSFFYITNILLKKLGMEPIRLIFSVRQMTALISVIGLQCVFAGLSTWFICRSVCFMKLTFLPQIISATAFSGVMGLLAFFSPAGIGVRDGFYFLILGSITGSGNAAVITIILRIIQSVVDLCTAGTGAILLHLHKRIRLIQ